MYAKQMVSISNLEYPKLRDSVRKCNKLTSDNMYGLRSVLYLGSVGGNSV